MSETMRAPDLVLHYDAETMRPAPKDTASGHVSVWLRVLTGEDDLAIQEAMIQSDGRGGVKIDTVAAELPKFCRSVERVSGLPGAGGDASAIDADLYKRLPRWMIIKIRARINELDALGLDEAVESD